MTDVIPAAGDRYTVGELIGVLTTLDPTLPVVVSVSMGPGTVHVEAGFADVVLPDEEWDLMPEGVPPTRCVIIGGMAGYAVLAEFDDEIDDGVNDG